MELRELGSTGLKVSLIGFGAGQIGDERISEQEVDTLLNGLLDCGITLIDTARGYGLSEERIGKYLSHRRREFILSTKVGYGIAGTHDWTYDCIINGVDEALRRLQTDYLDIAHLHSCPLGTLEYGEVIEALAATVRAGKVRVAAYSGDNEPLDYAVASGRFASVMPSVNICDQRVIDTTIKQAIAAGIGVIAKRPIANAPWRFATQPHGDYCETYWLRLAQMKLDPGLDWQELALRFISTVNGVASAIVGTTSLEHMKTNIALIERGPLPAALFQQLRAAFQNNDDHWIGQV